MGFNSAVKQRPEFVPTTPKELHAIEKRARAREEERKKEKEARSDPRSRIKYPKGYDAIREALLQKKPVRIDRTQLFEKLIEMCREKGLRPPAYRLYEKKIDADASFMFDLQQVLASLNWQQLAVVVDTAVGQPIATRNFSAAFWLAMQVIVQAFDVQDYLWTDKGEHAWVTIKDEDALEQWPVPARKRKSENDFDHAKEEKQMLVDADNRRKLSARADDEDEEEVADVADDEEEEEEDEDEKPAKKPAKKKGGFGSKKKANKSKSDDDDDDEDEKPARKKKSAGKKSNDDDDDEKPAKAAATALSDKTVVYKVKEREKGGPKSKLLALVPKKGITIKELTAAAKEEGLSVQKVKPFASFLMKFGFLKTK